jgi:hypothetical protein
MSNTYTVKPAQSDTYVIRITWTGLSNPCLHIFLFNKLWIPSENLSSSAFCHKQISLHYILHLYCNDSSSKYILYNIIIMEIVLVYIIKDININIHLALAPKTIQCVLISIVLVHLSWILKWTFCLNFFRFFTSRTTRPISSKFGTNHLCMSRGIQVCSSERECLSR